eukprot:COSAG06_NODE_931_length_11460_cov_4.121644_11_plen_129_part_00
MTFAKTGSGRRQTSERLIEQRRFCRSIHRGASVFVQDSSGVNISGCVWNQTGGNGLLFSNNVTDSQVTHSEFVHIGAKNGCSFLGFSDLKFARSSAKTGSGQPIATKKLTKESGCSRRRLCHREYWDN